MEVGMMCAIQAGVWTKLADFGDLVLLTKLQGVALYLPNCLAAGAATGHRFLG
jgi:hypothetical protein